MKKSEDSNINWQGINGIPSKPMQTKNLKHRVKNINKSIETNRCLTFKLALMFIVITAVFFYKFHTKGFYYNCSKYK